MFGKLHLPKNHCAIDVLGSAPLSKNAVSAFQIARKTNFFYLGRFLKNLADDQCSSITKGRIYHIKHMTIQPSTIEVN